ncbi:ABC transporter permease [Microbacterium sp. SORGH_AS_0888]|uniref:ABC transporter permease n=1 Tax=Microbacterium sp. SORGH_AS_0888 TaxID=3041791 RepID=UPI0027D8FB5B|nr:ABC transporter permease [Microbacterium sp. SORGH_AS_0888]
MPTARSPWFRFAARRLAGLAATLATLVVVSFLIVQLIPGDPAVALAGSDATTAEIEQLRARLGLDLPLWQQFGGYVGGLLTGDLGTSFRYGVPVAQLVAARLPFTVTVSLVGILVVLVVAVPLGMAVGVLTRGGRRRWMDAGFGAATGLLDSLPGYVLATLLVILLGTGVGLLPALPPAYTSRAPAASFVLPVIALSVGPICTVARVVRRETAVVLGEDYIRTARGWRLPAATLYLRHMLPNLLTTTLTLSGLVLSGMLGGALVIESVFALPGLGTGIIQAILDRDYPVIQGMVVVIGSIAAVITVIVDVLLGIVDPRTLGGSHGSR